MDFKNMFKPTELNKIYSEISTKSEYQKDMQRYLDIGFAQGFVEGIKLLDKDYQHIIIENFKKDSNKSDTVNYILRLWNEYIECINSVF